MNVFVMGCGRWGSFIAWYLNKIGKRVTLYGRPESNRMQRIMAERTNGLLDFPPSIELSTDLSKALDADVIAVSVGAQNLRAAAHELNELGLRDKVLLLCMKGLEISTSKRLSVVAHEELHPSNKTAVWLGPGHVQDFKNDIPSYMVIDSDDDELKKQLADEFSSRLIHLYYGSDMLGNEIGAAIKNVIGLAAGGLDAMNMSALKGALTSRGTYEVSLLIKAMGGDPMSAYGLCHLGDYAATVFSEYSHNRQFGEAYMRGLPYDGLAEGYYTAPAVVKLAQEYNVKMPICEAVYGILYKGLDPKAALESLLARQYKLEYHT